MLRRFAPVQEKLPDMLVCGRVKIDLESKMVYIDDEKVVFSKKEFEVISLLASHPGKIYSREDLISELWKDAPYVLDRTVDVHIAAGVDGRTVRHTTAGDVHPAVGVNGSAVCHAAAGDVHIAAGVDDSAVRHGILVDGH